MTLGIVSLYYGQSGKAGFYNKQEIGLARAMKARGYSCVVFYPVKDANIAKEEVTPDGITIVYCPAKTLGVHSRYDWNVLLKYHVDVIQIGSDNQLFMPDLVRFCKKHGIRFYHYIGTLGSDSGNELKRKLLNALFVRNVRIYRQSKCFAKTQAVYDGLRRLGVEDVEIMPVGLDTSIIPEIPESQEELRKQLQLPQDRQIVLFVGRMDPYKRPLELLELMKQLGQTHFFVLIGTGSMDGEVQAGLDALEGACRYRWIKQIPNVEIHKYYAASDYFVNFNDQEIFGMSILEAMYHGCTVVAVHAPGPDMIVENGVSGWLVEDTEKVMRLLMGNMMLDKGACHQRISGTFLWEKTTERAVEWVDARG
ncbi:MAG: glycosyltransferase [Clostridia bacterium]|nr:glycosyltransferase [Clostridia bacterium]